MTIVTETTWAVEKLWGAVEIAKFAGVSEDTIYRWEQLPDCPISKPGGRYFSTRSALKAWLTRKDAGNSGEKPVPAK